MEIQESEYRVFVRSKLKPTSELTKIQNGSTINLIHAAMLISGEAGELLDAIKKHVVYGKPLDRGNIIEELGDLEFGMEYLRLLIDVSRRDVINSNVTKLNERYKKGYTDKEAIERDVERERGAVQGSE